MQMEKLYRIEELGTTGWLLIESGDVKLTKDQAKERINFYLSRGYNPNCLRATPDV